MATATASCRQLMYLGFFAPRAAAPARASHTGGHSEPGEDKIKSTPLRSIAFNIACPPCMMILLYSVVEGVNPKHRIPRAASGYGCRRKLRKSEYRNPKQFP